MKINAQGMHFKELNEAVRRTDAQTVNITGCNGQRYIASGLAGKTVEIEGTPGNALGAYLDGAKITVWGNVQDAVGDTMNEGLICVHGSAGDATGYAMRGGAIYIRSNAGYRAGIHMKAYREKLPVLVIGACAGSFLGEYQAGGVICVLGIGKKSGVPVGNFCGTGMHGGKIYLQCESEPQNLSAQLTAQRADVAEIAAYIAEYCRLFGADEQELMGKSYYMLTPNTKNPYQQLYTHI